MCCTRLRAAVWKWTDLFHFARSEVMTSVHVTTLDLMQTQLAFLSCRAFGWLFFAKRGGSNVPGGLAESSAEGVEASRRFSGTLYIRTKMRKKQASSA